MSVARQTDERVMSRSSAEATVAIVDDDEAIRDSTAALLASVGFRVQAYGSGRKFLESDDGSAATCLVIDCQMPGMGGFDLVDRLISNGAHAPVILMTGNCGRSTMIRARKAGVVAMLEKPFSEELLLDSIYRALD